jgi:hypothetical protein
MDDIIVDKIILSRRRSIALRVTWDAQVIIRVPYGFDRARIDEILREKREWILRKLAFVRTIEKMALSRRLAAGTGIPYLGRMYPVRAANDGPDVRFEDGFFIRASRLAETEALLRQWYRAEAARLVGERLRRFLPHARRQARVAIGNAICRMGSCDSGGRLIFSWRLAAAPAAVIDYVVVHEVAHLEHLNHSAKFWAAVERIYPEYREGRLWLRKNSYQLML